MVRHIHATLHRAFGQAVKWGYLVRNIVDAVDPPTVPRREMRPPDGSTLKQLLDAANVNAARYRGSLERGQDPNRASQEHGDRLAALWTVAVYSGCRQAELLGLKWDDIDLEVGTLTVRRILSRARGSHGSEPVFGEPKTSKSRRIVSLPSEAIQALRGHKAQQNAERLAVGANWADYGLVFSTHLGTPLHSRNVLRDFKKALVRAGIAETFRFHDIRHAHATLMLQAGVPMKIASERLGHSAIGITMDLYTHAIQSMDMEAAELVQRALRG
jgi:integrase